MEILIAFLKAITLFFICLGLGIAYEIGRLKRPILTFVIHTILAIVLLTICFYM